jgi:pyruvate kinase
MLLAGMDVARLNFSHASHEQLATTIATLRSLEHETGRVVAVLADLSGPKLRLGELAPGEHHVVTGDLFTLVAEPLPGDGRRASINYPQLLAEVRPGEAVLIDDGLIRLVVEEVRAGVVACRVLDGGRLRPRKGVNLPDSRISLPSLTEKDIADLGFILGQDIDYIALSFVRTPADVLDLKHRIRLAGRDLPVIAKLEKPQAIERLEDILEVSAGVMVARGDLGVEMPPEEVPHIQKQIIKLANAFNKPVITATQMLESMVHNPQPTRAEASDVANAILDGTDAVMLSAESAVGQFPVRSIEMMRKIVQSAQARHYRARLADGQRTVHPRALGEPFTRAVVRAAVDAALAVDARAIVVYTLSGTTALVMSKHHPPTEVVAFTPSQRAMRRMALYRGVRPCPIGKLEHTDELIYEVERYLIEHNIARVDDAIVILSGAPLDRKGPTNLMELHTIAG